MEGPTISTAIDKIYNGGKTIIFAEIPNALLCFYNDIKTKGTVHIKAVSIKGPFESSVVKAEKCVKWSQPIDKNPLIFLDVELYNTSTKINLLRGNITFLSDCKNTKLKAKGYYWENNKWKLIYLMNNIGCNSVFMSIATALIGIRYDKKNCIFYKGKYTFDNLDSNRTQHLLGSVQDYGRIKWRHEFFSQAGSAFCWEFETVVVPLGTFKINKV